MRERRLLPRRAGCLLLAVLFCLLFPVSGSRASAPSDEETSRIFRSRKTSGGMVLAAKDGRIVYSFCYGYADKKAKEAVSPETYFKLASVSKLVTAAAVMRLVDAGKLDLDENVGHILGDPAYEAANPRFPQSSLTSRHLMSHTSGIRDSGADFGKKKKLSELLNPKNNKQKTGFLRQEPGTVYRYSNYGAGIMGCVLEKLTGLRLTDAARQLLFDPMGMDAAYDPSLLREPQKIVTTYRANGSADITRSFRLRQPYRAEADPERDYGESFGGLWMRGEDLCRIGIMLCDLGEIDGQRILSEASVRDMLSSQAGKPGISVDSPYGLNVERIKNLLPDRLVYGHQGLSNGVLCSLYFDPETRFVFTLVTNGCNVKAKQDRICLLSRDLFGLMWSSFAEETAN